MQELLTDLHRHLDGSLRVETAKELAHKFGIPIPSKIYFEDHMGLSEALELFKFSLSLLQDPKNVERVTREIVEDSKEEGVRHLEIRYAPQLHLDGGARIEEVVDASISGLNANTNLILCGIFGEDPKIYDVFFEMAKTRSQIVGIDLAGAPPADKKITLKHYAKKFNIAREKGIRRTVHASEGRDVSEIGDAITFLHAERIGHGTTLLDDPKILDLVCEKGITIESCPTSNVQVNAIKNYELHPLSNWIDYGVSVVICPDNTLFSQINSKTENEKALKIKGMNVEKIEKTKRYGYEARFIR